jgi:hypothetical protein
MHAKLRDAPLTAESACTAWWGAWLSSGMADLELRGMRLIERVHAQGIALSASQLEAFQADLHTYLTYLGSL